jgi:hypothetical protein
VRLSTLGYALLALLARGPRSGYDLAQRMNRPIGFFWQAQHSQIYPELARLEQLGWVTHQVIVQEDRRRRSSTPSPRRGTRPFGSGRRSLQVLLWREVNCCSRRMRSGWQIRTRRSTCFGRRNARIESNWRSMSRFKLASNRRRGVVRARMSLSLAMTRRCALVWPMNRLMWSGVAGSWSSWKRSLKIGARPDNNTSQHVPFL